VRDQAGRRALVVNIRRPECPFERSLLELDSWEQADESGGEDDSGANPASQCKPQACVSQEVAGISRVAHPFVGAGLMTR
jgi:hypothetical protein